MAGIDCEVARASCHDLAVALLHPRRNEHWFYNLEEAKITIEDWRTDYNGFRPHSSLENLTTDEFIRQYEVSLTTQSTTDFNLEVAQLKG